MPMHYCGDRAIIGVVVGVVDKSLPSQTLMELYSPPMQSGHLRKQDDALRRRGDLPEPAAN